MSIRRLKVSFFIKKMKPVPKIVLAGEWFKKAGFEVGENIIIEVSQNKLIIKNGNKSV